MYTIKRMITMKAESADATAQASSVERYIELDMPAAAGSTEAASPAYDVPFAIIKFTPKHVIDGKDPGYGAGEYKFVSECSGRGVCNTEEGLCQCFKGYYM